jgi:large subunit ribosomal protein L11
MAKKEITSVFKIQAPGGTATPAPPIGPALGANGVNPGQFIQQFNAATAHLKGTPVGVVITVYKDRTFTFITKSPPASVLLKRAAELAKASSTPGKEIVGKVTRSQCLEIGMAKMEDLNARTPEAAQRMVEGTARSCGIEVVEG